jgi:hypothetical protein
VAEAESVNELRQNMSSSELIKRDKLDYRLGTDKVRELPREVCYDILQDICRTLQVKHVQLIVPSIKRMEKVVCTFPRIRSFLKDVCNTVLSSEEGTGPLSSDAVDRVIPTLHEWMARLRTIDELERLHREVCRTLATRSTASKSAGLDRAKAASADAKERQGPIFHPRNTALIVQELHELVGAEDELNVHKESGLIPVALGGSATQTGVALENSSSDKEQTDLAFTRRFIAHFQRLFQVKSVPGVFPKLNEVYVYAEEANNAFARVREMLQLPRWVLCACVCL